MIYQSINHALLQIIEGRPESVLDVGCGTGIMGGEIKKKFGSTVTGVTYSSDEKVLAEQVLDSVIVADINEWVPEMKDAYDCILCCHVLEHLYDPVTVLKNLRSSLRQGGHLYVAYPNILFWKQRLLMLGGTFQYTDGGIMDRTHFRFYDWQEFQKMLVSAGGRIEKISADGYFPLGGQRRLMGKKISKSLDQWVCHRWPGLWAWQFLAKLSFA